ncbi:30S ribosomal protein S4e [Candidatus Woesearchaeota archaeon]|nr:MAG: 30S ribosomal protein S4e [Candidatus Woesearchaeota archaeon]
MVKQHLSRLAAPKTWPIKRKGIKFVTRPSPGPHSLETSMPINVILKEVLKFAKTTSEVKKVLHDKRVLVNKKVVKDYKFPVGLFDVLEIANSKEAYRMVLSPTGKFKFIAIDSKESNLKPYKITGKTILKGNKVQLNLDDGTNILVAKDNFKVNDTLYLSLDKKEIKEHLPFKEGMLIYILGGNKVSSVGKLSLIKTFKSLQPDNIIFKTKDGEFETRKNYAMVIGKDKPLIKIEE